MKSTKFVCYQYLPPKERGAFKMPSAVLYSYPVICKFTYLKMMAIEVIRSLNINRAKSGLYSVCQGVLDCESRKMNKPRKIFNDCDQPLHEKYLAFFDAFNKSHSYSMVCHPVGIHNDHFKEDHFKEGDDESKEQRKDPNSNFEWLELCETPQHWNWLNIETTKHQTSKNSVSVHDL